jgi:hypothetical protein
MSSPIEKVIGIAVPGRTQINVKYPRLVYT